MLIHQLAPAISWIQSHPQWAGIVAFTVAFLESIAVIGTFIPGSVTMTALGGMIGLGLIPLDTTLFWAIMGALAGDFISYYLGYHFKDRLPQTWPFNRYPKLFSKSESFFQKHGGKSIFIGRFVGPIRAFVPIIAGMLNLAPRIFIPVNILSAIIWAPVYLAPGYLLGTASQSLPPDIGIKLILLVLAIIFLLVICVWLINKISKYLRRVIDYFAKKQHHYIHRHCQWHWLKNLLTDAHQPSHHRQSLVLYWFCFCTICSIVLVWQVVSHGHFVHINLPIWHFFRSLYTISFAVIAVTITASSQIVAASVSLLMSVWLWFSNNKRLAYYNFILLCVTVVCIEIIKHLVHSPRPTGILFIKSSFSFPSGHVFSAMSLYGFLCAIFLGNATASKRIRVYSLLITYVILIALTRLYLGAHWFTDVLGGFLIASALLAIFILFLRRKPYQLAHKNMSLAIVMVLFCLCFVTKLWLSFTHDLEASQPIWQTRQLTQQQWWHLNEKQLSQPKILKRNGKVLMLINLQWLAQLKTIQQSLQQQGWQIAYEKSLVDRLSYWLTPHPTQRAPIPHWHYHNQLPVQIMVKSITFQQKQYWVILRLWPTNWVLTSPTKKLWFATVSYLHNLHTRQHFTDFPPALNWLRQSLGGSIWQSREVSSKSHGTIILVQAKAASME